MEIRNIFEATLRLKELEKKQRGSAALSDEENLQLSELQSYIDFILEEQSRAPNKITIKRSTTPPELVIAEYRDIAEFYEGFVITRTRGGIYLKTADILDVGATIRLKMNILTEKINLDLIGKVVWSSPRMMGKIPPGMGIKFSELQPESREILDAFVDGECRPERLREIK